MVKGALGALAGSAAVGVAGAAARRRLQRPRVLGVTKFARNLDLKKVASQIGHVAERVEARSEDVRRVSALAKDLSKKLS